MTTASDAATTWHVKKEDGTVYGPISIKDMINWAAEGRISPEDLISSDKSEWSAPQENADLRMEWTVELEDGTVYGPIHLLAFADLVSEGAIDISTPVTNVRHNVSYPLAQVLLPALTAVSNSLRDEIGLLGAELDAAEQSRAEAARQAEQAAQAQRRAEESAAAQASKVLAAETAEQAGADLPKTIRHSAEDLKKAEHWEVLYHEETAKAEAVEKELREQLRSQHGEMLELSTELDEVRSKLAKQEKINAEFENFSRLADSGGDDRITVMKGQFKHLLDSYNQISQQYENLSRHAEDQTRELEQLRLSQSTIQKNADKRIADMTAELQHEREEADKARSKLTHFEKNYTELLRSYRDMNDKLVKLRQEKQ
jgi:chromosome segregation ATPase